MSRVNTIARSKMKRLILTRLLLLSRREKKAKSITFHPDTTAIIGENDTGKSSLIKSIYHTFGADVKFHSTWDDLDIVSIAYFYLGEREYRILRYGRFFALYDKDYNLISAETGITKGIAPILNQMFEFQGKSESLQFQAWFLVFPR